MGFERDFGVLINFSSASEDKRAVDLTVFGLTAMFTVFSFGGKD